MTIRYQSLRGKRFLQDNTQHFPLCTHKKVSLICLALAPRWRQEMPHFCGGRRSRSRQPPAPLAAVSQQSVCDTELCHIPCVTAEKAPGFCCRATQESLELVASLIHSPCEIPCGKISQLESLLMVSVRVLLVAQGENWQFKKPAFCRRKPPGK